MGEVRKRKTSGETEAKALEKEVVVQKQGLVSSEKGEFWNLNNLFKLFKEVWGGLAEIRILKFSFHF